MAATERTAPDVRPALPVPPGRRPGAGLAICMSLVSALVASWQLRGLDPLDELAGIE